MEETLSSQPRFEGSGGQRGGLHWLVPGQIFAALFMMVLFFATLSSGGDATRMLGYAFQAVLAAAAFLLSAGYFLFSRSLPRHSFHIMSVFLLIILWYVLSGLVNSPELRDSARYAQLAFIFLFFLQVQLTLHRSGGLLVMGYVSAIFVLIHLFVYLAQGAPAGFTSVYANPNVLGAYMFGGLFFLIIAIIEIPGIFSRAVFFGAAFLALIVLLASENRSAILALLAAAGTYIIWPVITRRKKFFFFYLFVVFAMVAIVTVVLAVIADFAGAKLLNAIVLQYTGGNLLSGREDIWLDLMYLMAEAPFFGHGPMADAQSLLGGDIVSSHNIYLQWGVQIGLVGMLMFLAVFVAIWRAFWDGRKITGVRLSAAFLTGILIEQTFEATLTQNQLSIGLIYWAIMGIGVSRATRGLSANKVKLVPAKMRA